MRWVLGGNGLFGSDDVNRPDMDRLGKETAQAVRSLYNSYLMVGFTHEDSMELIHTHIMASGTGGNYE